MGLKGLRIADFRRRMHRGQYSDAVLSELENQNDQEIEGISAKVKMLKDVRPTFSFLLSPPSPLLSPSTNILPPCQP